MYITIAELPEYIKRAERLLDEEERSDLIYFLSTHPKAGVVLQGKGEKENLSKSERNELAKLVKLLIATYQRKKQ